MDGTTPHDVLARARMTREPVLQADHPGPDDQSPLRSHAFDSFGTVSYAIPQ